MGSNWSQLFVPNHPSDQLERIHPFWKRAKQQPCSSKGQGNLKDDRSLILKDDLMDDLGDDVEDLNNVVVQLSDLAVCQQSFQ